MIKKAIIAWFTICIIGAILKLFADWAIATYDRMPTYEETPRIMMTALGDQQLMRKLNVACFYVGGIGGISACTFAYGAELVTKGEATLEIGLTMLVMMLVFFYAFTADRDPDKQRRHYDFDKYMKTPEYYDPTLDVEGKKSLEDFRDRPSASSQIINYDPKDMAEKYRNM